MTPRATAARDEARLKGARKFLGDPCYKGHDGWRYVSSQECCACCHTRSAMSARAERGASDWRRLPPAKIIQRVLLIPRSRTCMFISCADYLRQAALGHLDQLYWGKKSVRGASYCEEHRALCYVGKPPRGIGTRPDQSYRLKQRIPARIAVDENIGDLAGSWD